MERAMQDTPRRDAIKRLAYIEGHLRGVRRMIEADAYCVDVLRQTHAIQRALESLEALLLRGHLRSCVPSGIREGREETVLAELAELYGVARRWRAADGASEAADDAGDPATSPPAKGTGRGS
jgi:DNA-binding FrmR family transcriptional regulator